jgi:tight adherence protein B
MRAGFSFIQGLETVANETTDPMRRELQRVFTEARLGRPIEDALGDVAERMASQDLSWAVMAIRIQREVGGNLAQLLDTVADTMTKRERLRREIRTLTAEGRFSAIVVSLFPPLFGLFLWVTQPDYMNRLFDESIGVLAVIVAVGLTVVGWFWMRRIVDIEV